MARKRNSRKRNKASKRQPQSNIPKAPPTKDIKSKTIFHNHVLCCQFLRNYVDHPMLKTIQPEDIEDYTERYLSYFGVEFEADTVKRIRIRDPKWENPEIFLVSLIEHKSEVDYNVSVQLLKYMACIWAEYEKHFGTDYKEQVKAKNFRYPPILPVVYHEGTDNWTASMHLKDRIFMNEIFQEYIPDFTYCLVNNRDFSNDELLEHQDEMSLIMLLNKIQNVADLSDFFTIPPEELNRIVKESPTAVIDILVMVMQALCTKLNLSSGETEACVQKVRTRDMGYLWANMEKIDVQAERKAAAQARAEREAAQAERDTAQAERDAALAKVQEVEAENARLRALLMERGIAQEQLSL